MKSENIELERAKNELERLIEEQANIDKRLKDIEREEKRLIERRKELVGDFRLDGLIHTAKKKIKRLEYREVVETYCPLVFLSDEIHSVYHDYRIEKITAKRFYVASLGTGSKDIISRDDLKKYNIDEEKSLASWEQ